MKRNILVRGGSRQQKLLSACLRRCTLIGTNVLYAPYFAAHYVELIAGCAAVLAVRIYHGYRGLVCVLNKQTNRKRQKEREESNESQGIQEGSPTNTILLGNYRLRKAGRWENVPRVSCEVGEISVR